ncbi:DUF1648 domain-containing protein [Corynebacterium freneyi]|uniref:DUF1648 domain-containing protein n=1 Tax=Corynebacterium freneyi TaxID=134034 RepID=UPI00396CF16F
MNGLTTSRRPDPHGRWDGIALAGFVAFPLIAVTGVVWWAASVQGRLPDPVAVHFGAGGGADGFGSLTTLLVVLVVVTFPILLVMGLLGSARRNPRILRRTLGPMATTFAGFMAGMIPDLVMPQLDRATAEGVVIGEAWTIGGTVAGLVVGVTVAAVLREPAAVAAQGPPDPALPRGPHSEEVRMGAATGMKVLLAVWVIGSAASALISPGLAVLLFLCVPLLAQTMVVRLRVDDDAVRLRALIGETIPLETITAARPSRYDWGDSGGVGIRVVDYSGPSGGRGKRIAVASRSGEAIDIDTTATNWTIVVPDGTADAIAGDINARLDRLHG